MTAVLNVLCGAEHPARDWVGAAARLAASSRLERYEIALWPARPADRHVVVRMEAALRAAGVPVWSAERESQQGGASDKNGVLASELLQNVDWLGNGGLWALGARGDLEAVYEAAVRAQKPVRCVCWQDAPAGAREVAALLHATDQGAAQGATAQAQGARLIVTDMRSPAPDTLAGRTLSANMERLRRRGLCQQSEPHQNVSVLEIPALLAAAAKVFVAGSPANHDPQNRRLPTVPTWNNVHFKLEAFHAMCSATPADTAAVLTYSQSACGGMRWDVPTEPFPGRALLAAPAWFATYRPRLGLQDDLGELADEADTWAVVYAPAAMLQEAVWHSDGKRLDVSASVARWLGVDGALASFGAYTAELEMDIAETLGTLTTAA